MPQADETKPCPRCDSPNVAETPATMPDRQGSSSRLNAPDSSDSREVLSSGERRGSEALAKSAISTAQRRRGVPRRSQPSHRWVDEGYYADNPWFDQERQRPVFSLGAPLPRKSRWHSKKKQHTTHPSEAKRSKEELAELGEVTPEQSPPPETEEADAPRKEQRRTSKGVTHGDRYNDAGQPVFEYMPEKADTRRTDISKNEEDKPNFGIDSEPIGRRENEEVDEGDEDPNKYRNWWARFRAKHPEPLAEFLAVR